jgi:K+-sensing histidine kinase KdpD
MGNASRLPRSLDARVDVWLVAVGSVVLALGIRLALGPITADAPLLLFFGAVILSARLGGFRAGVLATALSALVIDFELIPPHWQFDVSMAWALRLVLFIGEGVFISAAAQSRALRAPGVAPEAERGLSGQLSLDARPVRVSALVREVTASMQDEASAKNVCVETVIDHGTGAIEGDSESLRQIVAGLVRNAIAFTPAGGRVCVRLRRRRDHVELSVVDTGQGIAEQDLEAILLVSGPNAGRLAQVRQQVRLHGGEMTVYSAGPGTGATVTVRLQRLIYAPSARAPEQLAV